MKKAVAVKEAATVVKMTKIQYFPFAFFEGKVVMTELAKVSIMTNALQYGNGIFGGIRGYVSESKKSVNIFRLKDHYYRFISSLKIINNGIDNNRRDGIKNVGFSSNGNSYILNNRINNTID